MARKKELFTALKVYAFTWLGVFGLFLFRVTDSDTSIKEAMLFFVEALGNATFLIAIHIVFLLVYGLFLMTRYFYRRYLREGLKSMLTAVGFRFVMPVGGLLLIFNFISAASSNEDFEYEWDYSVENLNNVPKNLYDIDGKHRGMSVFGWRRKASDEDMAALVRNNIEWVAVIPFCYQETEQTSEMNMPDAIGKWSGRDSTFIKAIRQLREKCIRVQLKPHLWIGDGWRSNINFGDQQAWKTWFGSYRKNMLHYATMAEMTEVELLCIGTELRTSLKNQPEEWIALIAEIREIYSGKLTYAANWDDSFEQSDFWSGLDYIGVQAYFPLTKRKLPDLKEITKGWERHIKMLEKTSLKYNKPILFTEVGYKSEASSTIRPWEWSSFFNVFNKQRSFKTQQLAYEAMFQQLWHKKWFSGTYVWQWDTRSTRENAENDFDFSPRFKPAENTLAKWYGRDTPY